MHQPGQPIENAPLAEISVSIDMSSIVDAAAPKEDKERSAPRRSKNKASKPRSGRGPRKPADGAPQQKSSRPKKAAVPASGVGDDGVTKRGSVARESDVKSVAGYVAQALRSDGKVELLAAGPPSVNRAVKAVCLARNYLEADRMDLVVDPTFLGTEASPASNEAVIRIAAAPRDGAPADAPDAQEFNVASGSVPTAVAGAIAKAVRKGDGVVAFAMGAQAVTRGIKAVWKAKTYLAEEGVALTVRPEFCKPEPDEAWSTKIAFKCLVAGAPAEPAAEPEPADAAAN